MSGVPRTRLKQVVFAKDSYDHYRYSTYGGTPVVVKWPFVPVTWLYERCADETHPGPPYRDGGPLDIWKRDLNKIDYGEFDAHTRYLPSWGTYATHYWGTWRPAYGVCNMADPSGWLTSWGDVTQYGATGWNKFKPGKPGAQLAVFIGELRDLPRMFQFKVKRFQDIGGQYLNYRFGWRPFLRDLQRFLKTTRDLDRRIAFLKRNNGKWLKRGGVVRQESNHWDSTLGSSLSPILPTEYYPVGFPHMSIPCHWSYEQTVWFEGSFRFWIPNIESPKFLDGAIRQMYGFTISPDVVWELIPWSWLIDWFTNIGDVMSNLSSSSSADNLVARYAYIMGHTKLKAMWSDQLQYYTDTGTRTIGTLSYSNSITWERKQRIEASPYGFSMSWPDFTPGQLAILAALGISRYH